MHYNCRPNPFKNLTSPPTTTMTSEGKEQEQDFKDTSLSSTKSHDQSLAEASPLEQHKSLGIQRAEILMKQYSNRWLKGIFFFSIFICMYISTLESQVTRVFMGYATDSYKKHSLLSTIGVIRGVVVAASLPAYARLSDIFGRLELFVLAMIFRVIGLVIQSQARDVQRYSGGMVLFAIGNAGCRILWQISLSDASTLRWRFLAIGILSFQGIINTWSSGEIVLQLKNQYSWSFGIGMWAFIFPLACIPYLACQLHMRYRASKTDEWKRVNENYRRAKAERAKLEGTESQSFIMRGFTLAKQVFWQVDLIGCLCIALLFGLLLVPLTLAGGERKLWAKASTIVPLVLGFVMIPIFATWEYKVARTPFLPFQVMKDRGVWAGFVIGILSTLISSMPDSYSYPVLLVGMNASVTVATRTPNLSLFVEGVSMPILGLIISRVRRAKPFVFFGNVVLFITMGIFVHFRGSNDGLRSKYYRDGVAVGMCLLGFAHVFFNRLVSVSVQSCTNHEYMATVTALFASFYQLGSAFGKCIAGAIWTQNMYSTIENEMRKLGVDTKMAKLAYQSPYKFITKHPWGTDPRRAVALAYAVVQKQLSITGLCLCVPLLVFTFFLRNHKLEDRQNLADDGEETGVATGNQRVIINNDKDVFLSFLKKFRKSPKVSEV